MTKVCKILVGLPGTGKSTYIKSSVGGNHSVASTDNIIEEIAREYDMTYDQAFSDLIGFAEKVFWNDLRSWSDMGEDIFVDRTNLSVKSRARIIQLMKSKGYTFEALVFPIPVDWEQRLMNREGKTIPPHVIQDMQKRFEFPTISEGFSKIEMYDEQLQYV